eukprot:2331816-Karenia_brevis.AAC.1
MPSYAYASTYVCAYAYAYGLVPTPRCYEPSPRDIYAYAYGFIPLRCYEPMPMPMPPVANGYAYACRLAPLDNITAADAVDR